MPVARLQIERQLKNTNKCFWALSETTDQIDSAVTRLSLYLQLRPFLLLIPPAHLCALRMGVGSLPVMDCNQMAFSAPCRCSISDVQTECCEFL